MKIQKMFQKDINRDINGVIKVSAIDDKSLEQELSEYVITQELRKHFDNFFDRYTQAIDRPTEKIGVWISGFFGSGKSHFLKMLSYILSNRQVCNRYALDYFKEKIDDSTLWAEVTKSARIPTETILFNVDVESQGDKDSSSILKVFAKMFYKHCGYFGENIKVVRLEQFLDENGKLEEFKEAYKKETGKVWIEDRKTFAFRQSAIVKILQNLIGMDENAAKDWFKGKDQDGLSVGGFVDEIKKYVASKGKNFRLLFMIDEIGQFIGDNGDLMLNLQSIVEDIGTKCGGQVWVMVTSQEDIDHVIGRKDFKYKPRTTKEIAAEEVIKNDFSKIQGRFDTRLSLSSSSVGEVIQKRILAKTPEAEMLLKMNYEKDRAVLKNLYSFNDAVNDIKGFSGSDDFSTSYPFIPYQFLILKKVFRAIRERGNSGRHLSGGERSMLSGFQEAAQKIQDKDEKALVPFYLFYDTLNTFLESSIREVIDRCQRAVDTGSPDDVKGLKQYDVDILKLLYLIRYIDDFKSNLENIAILMIDSIDVNTLMLKKSITESLERLLKNNYITRNGELYFFLTNEEQEVAKAISQIQPEEHEINKKIADIVFNDIYQSKRIKYGRYDFQYDQYVDETVNGSSNSKIRLRIVTRNGNLYDASEPQLITTSRENNEAIIILSDSSPYFAQLEESERIRKYVSMHNVSLMPESLAEIVRKRNNESTRLLSEAKENIEKAIRDGRVIVAGEIQQYNTDTAKSKIEHAMKDLIQFVFSSNNMVNDFVDSDAEIKDILKMRRPVTTGFSGSGANNEFALNEIVKWLSAKKQLGFVVSVGEIQRHFSDIPFGWREIDIAAMLATLVVKQKIELILSRTNVVADTSEAQYVDYLRKRSLIDNYAVKLKEHASEELIKKSSKFLREYEGIMDIKDDEDKILETARTSFRTQLENSNNLLSNKYSRGNYPGKKIVNTCKSLMTELLGINQNEPTRFLQTMLKKQDDLLDNRDDMKKVNSFFGAQSVIFDEATALMTLIEPNIDYFVSDTEAYASINKIKDILALNEPYNRIKEIPEEMAVARKAYENLLQSRKNEVAAKIDGFIIELTEVAKGVADAELEAKSAVSELLDRKSHIEKADSVTDIDAMIPRLERIKNIRFEKIEQILSDNKPPVEPEQEPNPVPNPAPKTATETTDQPAPKQEPPKPVKRRVRLVNKNEYCKTATFNCQADVDSYIENLKKDLSDLVATGDIIKFN